MLIFILVYLLSIIVIHLIYRQLWIQDRTAKSHMRSRDSYYINTTLSDFYNWVNNETETIGIMFYIPIVNTALVLYQCLALICIILGKCKFI